MLLVFEIIDGDLLLRVLWVDLKEALVVGGGGDLVLIVARGAAWWYPW